jgi:hypothetical protein
MTDDVSRDDVFAVVDRAVEELLAAAGVEKPPVDALALARHLGLPESRPRGRRLPEPTEERRQWDAARALGVHFKPAMLRRLDAGPGLAGGSLANLFAQRLLVPTAWFGDDAPAGGYDLLELQELYRTAGHEVIAWRFLDLPAPCAVTVVDDGHVRRRRSNAWRVIRELHPAEQQCQRYVHHHGRPHVVCQGGWTVQGWPVHHGDYPREILRSVTDV